MQEGGSDNRAISNTSKKDLANQLREMEQEISAERVAHRIRARVGKEYETINLKVAVRA